MKRILLSILSVATISATNDQPKFTYDGAGAPNVTDFQIKGQQSVLGLQDYIFNLQTNIQRVNGAKRAITTIKNIQQMSSYFASSGYAAVFSEQYSTSSVVSALQYIQDHMNWIYAYNSTINNLLKDQNTTCYDNLYSNFNTLSQATQILTSYATAKQTNQTLASIYAQQLIQICSNYQCENVLYDFIANINSEYTYFDQNCEMPQRLFQGSMQSKIYRGNRDQSINVVGGLLNQVLIALMVQSAYLTLSQLRLDAWVSVQDKYGQQIKVAFENIMQFDQILQTNYILNAGQNLNYLGFKPDTDQQVIADKVALYLSTYYPNKYWVVAVSASDLDNQESYYACSNCIVISQFYQNFNILIQGIDQSANPNVKLLNQQDWATYAQTFTDAFNLVTNLIAQPQYCFQSVLANFKNLKVALNGGTQQNVYHKFVTAPKQSLLLVVSSTILLVSIANAQAPYGQVVEGDIGDDIKAGIDTLTAIQKLVNSIEDPLSFSNSSDAVMAQMKNVMGMINQIASPGLTYYVYGDDYRANSASDIFQDTFDSLDSLSNYYQNYAYYLLKAQNKGYCSLALAQQFQDIVDSFQALEDFFQYYTFGNPQYLQEQFMLSCDNNVCSNAIMSLISSMIGDFEKVEDSCDILSALVDGSSDRGFYQGHRDMFTSVAAFGFSMMVMGVTMQSGYQTISESDYGQWKDVQSQYSLLLSNFYDRIVAYDSLLQDQENINWNAERNLRLFLKEQVQAGMTHQDVSTKIQAYFTQMYPSRYWIVYTYDNIQGESVNSWKCKYCFAALNVQGAFNILMGSVDRNSVANTALINDPYFTSSINNYVNQASMLVNDWFNYESNSNCLMGVFATSGSYSGAVAGDKDFNGIKVLESQTLIQTSATIWAVQGVCPHQQLMIQKSQVNETEEDKFVSISGLNYDQL
ncbi:UNKNOWN [Stylonychia lemnae]|uniref:Uncharacterized protein n=1 Tax=Stylonychia lemnae TaxID=5949 RepID=A0A078A7K4_STYLE|nr:UNKNOWN [Stylonychia lemnae]|eukprot:CDW77846.1 UNKNOWN [Stylonychia lemnae]